MQCYCEHLKGCRWSCGVLRVGFGVLAIEEKPQLTQQRQFANVVCHRGITRAVFPTLSSYVLFVACKRIHHVLAVQ